MYGAVSKLAIWNLSETDETGRLYYSYTRIVGKSSRSILTKQEDSFINSFIQNQRLPKTAAAGRFKIYGKLPCKYPVLVGAKVAHKIVTH